MAKKNPWYENDDFWEKCGPVLFSQQKILDTPDFVDKVVDLLSLQPGIKVLDLCCGVGRHSLEFARRGYNVTGIDRTKSYLDKAAKIAKEEKLNVEFVQEDMRRFIRPDSYDLILNLYTSFGYFEDQDDDRLVAANMFKSLKKGGAFLMEMASKEITARIFQERDWNEVDDYILIEERKIIENFARSELRWIILKDNQKDELKLTLRLYSAAELELVLREAGFDQIDIYGNMLGGPYDNKAARLIVAARKL